MAAPMGDKGRDAQLFVPTEAVKTAFQYSVAEDWEAKINRTAARLAETMPETTELVYCTNQVIGPAGDALVERFRKNRKIALDIRDRSWFVERENSHEQRQIAAEELAKRVVDPFLSRKGITSRTATALSEDDSRLALLHLGLEGYDAETDRNLTKSSFEALALAALHGSSAEKAVSRENIVSAVKQFVPSDNASQVEAHIDGALRRLSAKNGRVKFLAKTDEYHLAFVEQVRHREAQADFVANELQLQDELTDAIIKLGLAVPDDACVALAANLREGVERVLFNRGEAFARAVRTSVMSQLDVDEVLYVLTAQGISVEPLSKAAAAEVMFSVLEDPSRSTQAHLNRLADAYTLFAFLRQTPDVQKVVLSIFSDGEIWLDSTIVLPLLVETLLEDEAERHYTVLLRAAVDAGFRLYVTEGIIEEIERHLNRSLTFARTESSEWRSGVPFVYAGFALSGRSRGELFDWLSEFRGRVSPEEDISEYLEEEFNIRTRNLTAEADAAPQELRGAIQEVWMEAHERRRQRSDRADMGVEIANRLVAHDVENSVGVIMLRSRAARSGTGYQQWWLTLDRIAFSLREALKDRLSGQAPQSPALSPDFLVQLLRLGPLRTAVEREQRVALPFVTALSRYDSIPKELIELADETRRRYEGQSERVVRRRVRDALNEMRWKEGPEARGGVKAVEARVKARLQAQAERLS
ncbi:hypothetical protein HN031_05330 [Nocardioides sp. zg-1308]|uniref:hypothetical protein n=1 Tax=Nocardioides sp. zg-1308 TaxID=2736253 RepID=UPI00155358C2|nr:hypothetical protein [Nocardioides sp. zg-1308]NPD04103.1 hypothetical protein [Nocardioides sp. zg-1308]